MKSTELSQNMLQYKYNSETNYRSVCLSSAS